MENDKYIVVYSQFRAELSQNTPIQRPLPYNWLKPRKTISSYWLVYFEMLDDYARELANIINQLLTDIDKLRAWDKVIIKYDQTERLHIVHEFIEPLCSMCLNLPYVIRSRFIFSVTHLCHQANQTIHGRKWKDDLPSDDKIYFSTMDKYAAMWSSFKKLKQSLERLSDKQYQKSVSDYRNQYHHRFPPHIGLGFANSVTRKIIDSQTVSYGIGASKPLEIKDVVLTLSEQHGRAVQCFHSFQSIVMEHLEQIDTQQSNQGDGE